MMETKEKRRCSKGVVFFAITFIIFNILCLAILVGIKEGYGFLASGLVGLIAVYVIIYCASGLVGAIKLLGLRSWARKLVLILAILGVLGMIVFIPLNHKGITHVLQDFQMQEDLREQLRERYDNMSEEAKSQMTMPADEFIEMSMNMTRVVGHAVVGALEALQGIYFLLLLLFLTRAKVKEQFLTKDA